MEETAKSKAVPAAGGNAEEAAVSRSGGRIEVKKTEKLERGIGFTRLVKAKMAARLAGDTPLVLAQRMYGQDSEPAAIIPTANEVVAGTAQAGNWAADVVRAEGPAV